MLQLVSESADEASGMQWGIVIDWGGGKTACMCVGSEGGMDRGSSERGKKTHKTRKETERGKK